MFAWTSRRLISHEAEILFLEPFVGQIVDQVSLGPRKCPVAAFHQPSRATRIKVLCSRIPRRKQTDSVCFWSLFPKEWENENDTFGLTVRAGGLESGLGPGAMHVDWDALPARRDVRPLVLPHVPQVTSHDS